MAASLGCRAGAGQDLARGLVQDDLVPQPGEDFAHGFQIQAPACHFRGFGEFREDGLEPVGIAPRLVDAPDGVALGRADLLLGLAAGARDDLVVFAVGDVDGLFAFLLRLFTSLKEGWTGGAGSRSSTEAGQC